MSLPNLRMLVLSEVGDTLLLSYMGKPAACPNQLCQHTHSFTVTAVSEHDEATTATCPSCSREVDILTPQ